MLTSTIDFHASDATFEERIFVGAKRLCIVFAGAALGISALDLMNVRSVEAAAEFARRLADALGHRLHQPVFTGKKSEDAIRLPKIVVPQIDGGNGIRFISQLSLRAPSRRSGPTVVPNAQNARHCIYYYTLGGRIAAGDSVTSSGRFMALAVLLRR